MNSLSIIFFGKPNSFESWEVKAEDMRLVKADHPEPKIKLLSHHQDLWHRYFLSGFHHFELYSYASAYGKGAGRGGVVIGVCLKSASMLEINETSVSALSSLLRNFRAAALDQSRAFVFPELRPCIVKQGGVNQGVLNILKNLSFAEITKETFTVGNPFLWVESMPPSWDITKYEDVYISTEAFVATKENPVKKNAVFSDPLNRKILNQWGNTYYELTREGSWNALHVFEPEPVLPEAPSLERRPAITYEPPQGLHVTKQQLEESLKQLRSELKKAFAALVLAIPIIMFFFSSQKKNGAPVLPSAPTNQFRQEQIEQVEAIVAKAIKNWQQSIPVAVTPVNSNAGKNPNESPASLIPTSSNHTENTTPSPVDLVASKQQPTAGQIKENATNLMKDAISLDMPATGNAARAVVNAADALIGQKQDANQLVKDTIKQAQSALTQVISKKLSDEKKGVATRVLEIANELSRVPNPQQSN